MIKIKEAIIVEGKYDKNTLSQIVDAPIIETSGFGIFKDKEKKELFKRLAEKRGVIILTDSDGAGFVIRNHLKGILKSGTVKQAYIPEITGREKRKQKISKEGLLGVEGMTPEIIISALKRAGATIDGCESTDKSKITKADMYELGILGGAGSGVKRKIILMHLGFPQKMSSNAMLDVVNALYTKDEFFAICKGCCQS